MKTKEKTGVRPYGMMVSAVCLGALLLLAVGCSNTGGTAATTPPPREATYVRMMASSGPSEHTDGWSLYRDLRFHPNRSDLQHAAAADLGDIVRYLEANPAVQLGLDGSPNPRGTVQERPSAVVIEQRITVVRDALITAGVSADRIETGDFRDLRPARTGQLAAMIRAQP